MKKYSIERTCLALAGIAVLGLGVNACVEETRDTQYDRVAVCADGGDCSDIQFVPFTKAFVVKTRPKSGDDRGSADSPLPIPTPKWYSWAYVSGKGMTRSPASSPEPGFGIDVAAYAVDVHGNYNDAYEGWVRIKTIPGELRLPDNYCSNICASEGLSNDCTGYCADKEGKVYFQNGMVGNWNLEVDEHGNERPTEPTAYTSTELRFAYGNTRLWLEDGEPDPVTGVLKGVNCPGVPTGVSEEYVFDDQTIYTIQYNPDAPDGVTPLLKQFGDVKARPGHDLVVSNVVSTGFYITDIVTEEGAPKNYNSIFIYSYSQPARVDIGDRICEATGGIAEFTGMTQMQFPSWGIQNKERSTAEDTDPAPEDGDKGAGSCIDYDTGETRPCTEEEKANMQEIVDCWGTYYPERAAECTDAALDARYGEGTEERIAAAASCHAEKKAFSTIPIEDVTPLSIDWRVLLCGYDGNATGDKLACEKLEGMESSVITINEIVLSNYFIDCDDNGNGKIDSNTAESTCRTECNNNPNCTEYSNISSYDQWKARAYGSATIGGETTDISSEISVASSSIIAGFDITEGCISLYDSNLRKNIFCQKRKISHLTGTLKQVLPGCYAAKINNGTCFSSTENIVMSVIEPRFQTDLVLNEEYNAEQKGLFESCAATCKSETNYTPITTDATVITQYIDCMKSC